MEQVAGGPCGRGALETGRQRLGCEEEVHHEGAREAVRQDAGLHRGCQSDEPGVGYSSECRGRVDARTCENEQRASQLPVPNACEEAERARPSESEAREQVIDEPMGELDGGAAPVAIYGAGDQQGAS